MARDVKRVKQKKRSYDNSRRQAQARETQRHIAEVAQGLFVERGYSATSIRDIADAAGVAVQTIYNLYDGKPAIIGRISDMAVVGDDEPVALADREDIIAIMASDDPRRILQDWCVVAVGIFGRFLPLLPVIREAAGADPAVAAAWRKNAVENRYDGTRAVIERVAELHPLPEGMAIGTVTDLVWSLVSFDTADSLISERGWTPEAYADWMSRTIESVLELPDPGPRAPRGASKRRKAT